ncbi:type II membrane protein [Exophiala xenobiotica]|uniref:Autophagy-related protein 27 n=1 Tax=Vermiconidia calcicola TaxID=1690605 RepID=A0AAV9QH74_9PEZI|nr:type II membrane protein [Exophiala xenobiotica]KAK5541026.1 type II membrane protein [Vermiconidia calcicola]KAK5549481.1 type II membrane protein [Chaetothyriales sp. CCFEE 6169]KAK5193869.1 type II membrane protein [Exophiala xenobiotica]KAK5208103.1 type II membrane protein [Exophiala xenobiotica]
MKTAVTTLFSIPLLLAQLSAAASIDCEHIRIGGKKFDVSKLAGRHNVTVHDTSRPPAEYNTTWSLDLCAPLKKIDGVPDANQCPFGTRVCGVVKSWNPVDDPDQEHVEVENVIPVAGNFDSSTGKSLDPKVTRLKAQDVNADGLQIEFNGGYYNKRKQRAVIQLQCDKERTGNEERRKGKRDGKEKEEDPEDPEEPTTSSLAFVSYGPVEGKEQMDVVRFNWRTKYACEDYADSDEAKKTGWGLFTWFILITFLGIAAYLIFGSWLNYNRYGARGWDLLPHGDTIRDIPYLFKDFSRKVVDTVSGGGSRGGYSAV